MPSITQGANNIGGFLPTFANTQNGEVRVLNGRNFRWHYDGPFSGWGNTAVSDVFPVCDDLPYYGLFIIDDRSILATPYGIYGQNNNYQWVKEFELIPTGLDKTDADYPWTYAFVGDTHYLSHPTVGIIGYNSYTCSWKKVKLYCCIGDDGDTVAKELAKVTRYYDYEVPKVCKENIIYSITSAGNRLILQAKDTIGHSAIDDGHRLECDPFCGGGFVSSSMLRYGKPLGVFKTLNGFIAFSTMGVMQARNLESLAAFQYENVNYNEVPINPWAITSFGDGFQLVFMGKSELNLGSLNRETFVIQPFELEMGSWLAEKEFIKQQTLTNQHAVALFYSKETKELFVSLNPHVDKNRQENVYTRSLVYNVKYKKWCSFDQWHRIIGPVNGINSQLYYYTLGFFGEDKALHCYNYSDYNTYCNCKKDLDSFIEIGLFGVQSESTTNIESKLCDFTIYVENNADLLNNELNNQLAQSEFEDNYRTKSMFKFNADVNVNSSLDGYTRIINSNFKPVEKENSIDSIFSKNYSCETSGLYHSIILTACGVNQFYSLKQIMVQLQTNGTTA